MPKRRHGEVSRLLGLLENADFARESQEVLRTAMESLEGKSKEWTAEAWTAFADTALQPFVRKWKALPAGLELSASPDKFRAIMAIRSGRWGVVPVYPWTEEKTVLAAVARIKRAIGQEHQDADRQRQARAEWLDDNGIPRPVIAQVVWGRRTGLRRATTAEAIGNVSLEREQAMMRRFFRKMQLPYQKAERRTHQALRGSESPAAAMVRAAIRRHKALAVRRTDELLAPRERDRLGYLLTRLFDTDFDGTPEEVSCVIRDLRVALSATSIERTETHHP